MINAFKLKNRNFTAQDFLSPDQQYAPVHAWFWNGPLSKDEIEKQLLEMQRLGIKAFYIVCEPKDFRPNTIPTLTDPNYLTDGYFEMYKFTVKIARELGMKFWIYDEGGWPSGGACGLVMYDHPEYARRTLDKRTVTLKAGTSYKKSDSDTFAAFINGDRKIDEGFTSDVDTEVDEYYSRPIAFESPGRPDIPDVTRAEATDYFIKLTHERYKEHLKEYFGNTVTAVFTDEPLAPPIPFREELVDEYEKQYGESVLPYLPAIFGSVEARDEALTARIRWFDLASRAFADKYLARCREWCNENGLAFTGHLDRDDEPRGAVYGKNFHLLRSLRCMDVPGIDVIWRQIFPNKNGKTYENRFFPRYASSAAAQNGTELAMTESFGVYGNGLTFEDMRFILGFQAIRGVTLFNPMKISYMRRGIWLAGELPSFEEDYACYAHLGLINKYMERLSYVLTRGERVAKTALYYPIKNFWTDVLAERTADEFDAIGFEMESRGVDFDIVDDDVILASEHIGSGRIGTGFACYTEIVIPPSALITDDIKKKLAEFEAGGGKVLYSANGATPSVELLSGGGDIVASRRRVDGDTMLCLFNQSTEKKKVTVKGSSESAYLIDITGGRILAIENDGGRVSLTLEGGECSAILFTERTIECERPLDLGHATELSDFTIRRTRSFIFGDMFPRNEDIVEPPMRVALGDWADAVGADYSGSCMYTAEFSGSEGDLLLDLGDVRYTAEVTLNGKPLGVRIMKPYTYEIGKELLRENNVLEITVTNTVANQQHYTKTFDKWGKWQLSPYVEKQDVFDLDSLPSGLFGPVKLIEIKAAGK